MRNLRHSWARRLSVPLLATAGLAYIVVLAATYFQATAPGSLAPNPAELRRLLFQAARPISALERRLAAADTPLGAGPLITMGTSMESPFYGQSLTAAERAGRDGERLALLDWIRSGASRAAYERDDYVIMSSAASPAFTPQFLVADMSKIGVASATTDSSAPVRVRIRSIFNQRCVNCHHADGDDTARLIPFDSYESIAVYLRPETHADRARPWLIATILSLFPLATLAGLTVFWSPSSAHLSRCHFGSQAPLGNPLLEAPLRPVHKQTFGASA